MRKLIVLLMLLSPLAVTDVSAQANAIEVYCGECRDPLRYPADWANFAFNQLIGDGAWMTWDQADDFFIRNPRGDRVYVDVDLVMGGFNLLGQRLPVWPRNIVKITLALPNGTIVEYLRSIFLHPLPVPSPPGPEPGPGENDPGDDDDSEDGVDDEPPRADPELPGLDDGDWCVEC